METVDLINSWALAVEINMIKCKNIIANEIIEKWKINPDISLAYEICDNAKNDRIHHMVFRIIVFPVISNGINNNIERDVIAAIKCIQNIYCDKVIWEKIGYKTEFELLTRLINSDCKNEWLINRYIETSVNWLKYCIHEWPSGVLYGINGANVNECDEILKLIKDMRLLNTEIYNELLNDVEEKTMIYRKKLFSAQQGDAPEPATNAFPASQQSNPPAR